MLTTVTMLQGSYVNERDVLNLPAYLFVCENSSWPVYAGQVKDGAYEWVGGKPTYHA